MIRINFFPDRIELSKLQMQTLQHQYKRFFLGGVEKRHFFIKKDIKWMHFFRLFQRAQFTRHASGFWIRSLFRVCVGIYAGRQPLVSFFIYAQRTWNKKCSLFLWDLGWKWNLHIFSGIFVKKSLNVDASRNHPLLVIVQDVIFL